MWNTGSLCSLWIFHFLKFCMKLSITGKTISAALRGITYQNHWNEMSHGVKSKVKKSFWLKNAIKVWENK